MFYTPVGGAFLLAVLFSLIGLYFLVLYISGLIGRLFNISKNPDWRDEVYSRYLRDYERWINSGADRNTRPETPNFILEPIRSQGFFMGAKFYQPPAALQIKRAELRNMEKWPIPEQDIGDTASYPSEEITQEISLPRITDSF